MKIIDIKKYFNKKKEEEKVIASIAIVFNVVDHASLMAAVLADVCLTKVGLKTQLVDIRDVFPVVDQYLWLDAGNKDTFKAYMQSSVIGCLQGGVYYAASEVLERSIFLHSSLREEKSFEDTVIGKVFSFLMDKGYIRIEERLAFTRSAMIGIEWLKGLNCRDSAVEAASYHGCLQKAYAHYIGERLSLNDIVSLLEGSEEEAVEYGHKQKEFSLAISRRCRYIDIHGAGTQYLTMTGPEVYGIIRRISLIKQNYCHVSEGSYGTVLFASLIIPEDILQKRGGFHLTPIGDKNVKLRSRIG